MKTLAVIPARSGSRGVPGKNTRDFFGKPLFVWAVEIGLKTCDRVVVTTDSIHTAILATQYGALAQIRPPFLAQDDTPMLPVIRHVLQHIDIEPETIVLLQPTSPLRTEDHVYRALDRLTESGADSVVSVSKIPEHYSPDMACTIGDGDILEPVLGTWLKRRQDARTCYYRDGTVYAIRISTILRGELLGKSVPIVIPTNESANIDDFEDWERAERLWRRLGR